MKIHSEYDDLREGLVLVISVAELEDNYWSTVDLYVPDQEDIPSEQFEALLVGLENAHEKLKNLLEVLGDDDSER